MREPGTGLHGLTIRYAALRLLVWHRLGHWLHCSVGKRWCSLCGKWYY